jgi:hypothetical protein
MAVENGVPSFLIFFAAIFFLMLGLLQRHTAELKNVSRESAAAGQAFPGIIPASAALAILCGLLVNGIVVDTIHWRHFWFYIGIALCRLKEE